MGEKYDAILIGAGPSNVFLAYELIQLGKAKKVLLIEQGKSVEKRVCPIERTNSCMDCKPFCNITCGFSGAGAFSDGKLTLYNEEDDDIYVGGILHNYIGVEETRKVMDYADRVYLEFGADPNLEGTQYKNEIEDLKKRAKKENIILADMPIRHLGTERSHEIYYEIEKYLIQHGINIMFDTVVEELIIENEKIKGVRTRPSKHAEDENYQGSENYYADQVVLGVGRKGANWLSDMCDKHSINTSVGSVDIGIRYELPDKVMADVNKYLYEAKFIARPGPFRDKVRTFCQNPSGFVATEVYDDNLTLVNGHSYKNKKSTNTNLAILCSHNFSHPFDRPIEYGRNVAKNVNRLAGGNILVQRLGDIFRGKRTWEKELEENTVIPTLKAAVPGDITFAIGYRTMTNIIAFIRDLDKVIPRFADYDNLLYAPEIKFYSNKLVIDNNFETNIKGLYSIGDGGGMTRGLIMASASGIQMARILDKKN